MVPTRLPYAGVEYATCGLGSAFTYPACWGKGYGRLIMDAATCSMCKPSADMGLLFCQPELQAFYPKSSWQALRGTPLFLGSLCEQSDPLRMMLFFSEKGQAGRAAFETPPWYVPQGW